MSSKPTDPEDAIRRIENLLALDPELPIRERCALINSAADVFVSAVMRLVKSSSPLDGGAAQDKRAAPASEVATGRIGVLVRGDAEKMFLDFTARYENGSVYCAYRVRDEPWQNYYVGPADGDSLRETAEEAARAAFVELANRLETRLAARDQS